MVIKIFSVVFGFLNTMTLSTLSHNDYMLTWICTLPFEIAATKSMLDEIHSRLPQPPSDHNAHTLGRLFHREQSAIAP
jgi:hypothetical protein